MGAGDIEHGKRCWGGGDVASIAVDVAEVEDGAEVTYQHPFKKLACPTLGKISARAELRTNS